MPLRGNRASLELFLLIDPAAQSRFSPQLGDFHKFINAQPATTVIAVSYMRDYGLEIAQDFTADRSLTFKALRASRRTTAPYAIPYLSLMDLVKRWPTTAERREILMISHGSPRLTVRYNAFRSLRIIRKPLGLLSPDPLSMVYSSLGLVQQERA